MKRKILLITISVSTILVTSGLVIAYSVGFFISFQTENGTLSTNAVSVNDSSASGGKAVKYQASTPAEDTCPPYPAFPDANCTGWQHTGVTLSAYSGSLNINTPGTVIDSKTITGGVTIAANNVTISRSKINGTIYVTGDNYTGIKFTDIEINGQNNSSSGITGSGFTCTRCHIYNALQGFHIDNNTTVQDSYVHDIYGVGSSHNEAYLSNGGSNNTVIHNNFDANWNAASTGGGMSSSLSFYGDFSQVSNVLVQNNLFNAIDGYCVYAGSVGGKNYPLAINTRFINNVFGRKYNPNCGTYGAATAYSSAGSGNMWSGNIWGDGAAANGSHTTGSPVTP